MLQLIIDNKPQVVEFIEFSDGAITCKLDLPLEPKKVVISFNSKTPVKMYREELSTVYSALEEFYKNSIHDIKVCLYLPYLPYARADRVFEEGNPSPLKCFITFLNSFKFNDISLTDVHNPKAISELKNTTIKQQYKCIREVVRNLTTYDYIIAPDKGAISKASQLSETMDIPLLTVNKKRDISSGRIIEITFPEIDLKNKKVIIIDDIMDGGGTFIPLGKKLKELGAYQVDLYVTHMIASKGLGILKSSIDKLYCYHTVANFVNGQDILNYNLNQ